MQANFLMIRSKKIIAVSLLIFFSTSCAIPPTPIQMLPNPVPMQMGIVDSKTYTSYLAREKRYIELKQLIQQELDTIEFTQLADKYGQIIDNQMQLQEKWIQESLSAQGSADPRGDYLRMNQFDTATRTYNIEGKLYMLDDIASIYTYWLVDFNKAQKFNQMAKDTYDKLINADLNNIPLSNYFNDNRNLYYAFFLKPIDAQWNKPTLPVGYITVKGRPDLVTLVSPELFTNVRKNDLISLGNRIQERERFIQMQLKGTGFIEKISNNIQNDMTALASGHWQKFIEEAEIYSPFEKGFLEIAQTIASCRGSCNDSQRKSIIASGEKALSFGVEESSIEKLNAVNIIHYWLALAYLQNGEYLKGIKHHEQLIASIDLLEQRINDFYKNQDTIVKEVQQEAKSKARKEAVLGFVLMAVMLAAGVYSSFANPMTSSTTVQSAGQSAAQFASIAMETLIKNKADTRMREALFRFISPYSLKLNRYMDKYQMVEYLLALGKGYKFTKNPAQALIQYEEAIRIIERQRSTISAEHNRISFLASRIELYNEIVPLLAAMGKPAVALEYAERAKSRAFVDLLGSARIQLKSSADTQAYENTIREQAELNAILSNPGVGAEQLDYLIGRVKRGIKVTEKVKETDPIQGLELQSLATVRTLEADEIKSLAGNDTALIEYFLTDNELIIFVAHSDGIKAVPVKTDVSQLLSRAITWRESIISRTEALGEASFFYNQLIRPVEQFITDKKLVFIPHRFLHHLPFQALYNGSELLIARHAVSYAPSATVLYLTEKKQGIKNSRALVVGNPTGDLVFAAQEAQSIAGMLPGSRLLMGSDATPAVLRQEASGYEFIHLATHAQFDPKNPLQSKILFARDEQGANAITASDLFAMNWQASLVTLSACESGLSKTTTGDEMIGLQRGIFFAGARSLIATLWPVDDQATGFFMQRFYQNLSSMPKNQALQKAQQDTRNAFPAPFYWAGFNLSGARN
ncbi:MAG: CHAT domain-containing protein [Desulfobacterales bacterium]|nr:CHAT domain-containing protein [Desulfobacterales bacterium]